MNTETLQGGAILDDKTTKSTDFVFGGESDLSVKLKLAYNNNTIFTEFNQSSEELLWYFCTILSGLTCLNYNIGTNYGVEDAKIIAERMNKDGLFNYKKGGRLADAIDYIRNYHNEISEEKVISYRLAIGSEEHKIAGEKNLAIQYGYFTSKEFLNDSQDDGIVQGVDFPKGYGHATTDLGIKTTVNSYKGKLAKNIYEIKDMIKLVENEVIYPDGYLFIKAIYMENIFKDVPDNIPFASSIKKAKDKGVVNGYSDGTFGPNNNLTRGEFMGILDRLGLLD